MKLTDYSLFADENIDPAVVEFLRQTGFDVRTVAEEKLFGSTDCSLLDLSVREGRVIVTHDSDFGDLAIVQNRPVIGIAYLRPGHIDSEFTIESLRILINQEIELPASFLITVRRVGIDVSIRVRDLTPFGEQTRSES